MSGENFLPTEKLHFLPNPLLSFMASSSLSLGPLKEWVVQAWAGPLDSTSAGPSALEVCIREAALLSDARFGWMASKPSHWSAPRCTQISESSLTASRGPCPGQKFSGPYRSPLQLSGSQWDGCVGCQVQQRCSAQPCLHPCHGEIRGKDLALKIPLKG